MEWGLEEAEFSWVLESNSLSYGSLKKGGAKITKTYRLYDLEMGANRGAGGDRATAGERRAEEPSDRSLPLRCRPSRSPLRSRRLEIREVRTRRDLQSIHSTAVADLCRRSALGAAAVDRGQGVSRPPQASVLPARRGDAVHRDSRRRDRGPNPGQRRSAITTSSTSANVGCFGMFECDRRSGRRPTRCWTPPPAGSAAAAARRSAARSTIRSTIPAACWSTGSTRRRGS